MNSIVEHALKVLKSRQFWTGVALFVVNGFDAIRELMPVEALPYLNGLIGMLMVYFRIDSKQEFKK